jgi:hypothetical protein
MEAVKTALEMLRLLPDPDQELSIQQLSEFTLFPELPVEIRLMIWRSTFRKGVSHYLYNNGDELWLPYPNDSPVSTRINQESRDEALKHYQILELKHWTFSKYSCTFWNVETDSITGNFNSLVCYQPTFDPKFIHFAASIRTLKILLQCVCDDFDESSWDQSRCLVTKFQYYRRLSELHIYDNIGWLEGNGRSRFEDCIGKLRKLFEGFAAKDEEKDRCSVPKIILSTH